MRTKTKLTVLLLALVMALSAFAGCDKTDKNTGKNAVTATVSFELCGGTNADGGAKIADMTVTVGEKYGALPTPKKDGYSFVGWCLDFTGSGSNKNGKAPVLNAQSVVDEADAPDGVITLFARWEQSNIKVNVTFDLRGGRINGILSSSTFTTDPATGNILKEITYGGIYGTTPDDKVERLGYFFQGWYTAADGAGDKVVSGTKVTRTDAHTLYAKWSVALWDFETSGGASGFTPYGSAIQTVARPSGGNWLQVAGAGGEQNTSEGKFPFQEIMFDAINDCGDKTFEVEIEFANPQAVRNVTFHSNWVDHLGRINYFNGFGDDGNFGNVLKNWSGAKTFSFAPPTGATNWSFFVAYFPAAAEQDKVFYMDNIRLVPIDNTKTEWNFDDADDASYFRTGGVKQNIINRSGDNALEIKAGDSVMDLRGYAEFIMPIKPGQKFEITIDFYNSSKISEFVIYYNEAWSNHTGNIAAADLASWNGPKTYALTAPSNAEYMHFYIPYKNSPSDAQKTFYIHNLTFTA